ncbi:hypothetical protein EON80_11170 [bacterium]|nr:MAG: hypothetical protein EON80_11170 [bacterium]
MAETTGWKDGDRVEIGGRTMLRPGFSLVGLTGIVFPTAPNAPAGCLTVAVDWQAHGYNAESGYPEGSLPLFVNVPEAHLTSATEVEEVKAKPKFQSKSQFKELSGQADETSPEKAPESVPVAPKPAAPKPNDEPEGERPRLRLV